MRLVLWTVVTIFMFGCGPEKPLAVREAEKKLPGVVDFNFQVKPILSDKCFACHGPDEAKREADLRLDTEEGAYAALGEEGDHHAIVPGRLSRSHAYLRMISDDPEYQMPPPESNLQLTPTEIATLTRWIEQGAAYKPHWSFIKPEMPEIPETRDKQWSLNAIDPFVLARLESEGLFPSPEADKATLIRRVSFDVTGLPPTLEQVDAFLADDSPDAYEKMVDGFLRSPAYGERMAAAWMDVARYADSDGYLDDKHRDFTPWRDWLIRAFNQNMPYDQFATWQLAGDLIPNPTQESILATAFNRLHKRNSEAGIVFEEFRVEYVADRTYTLGTAFLGLSLACARCHDHKYDPIKQEDYYKVAGFFNSTHEIGSPVYGPDQTPGPSLLLTSKEQEDIINFLHQKIGDQEKRLEQYRQSPGESFSAWASQIQLHPGRIKKSAEQDLVAYYPFDRVSEPSEDKMLTPNAVDKQKPATIKEPLLRSGARGQAYFVTDYNAVQLGHQIGWYERTDPFSVALWLYPDTVYQEAGIFYHCEDLRLGYKGYSLHLDHNKLQFIMAHSWPYNALQVTTREALPEKQWTHVTITYDGSSKADGIKVYINGSPASVVQDYDNLYKGILYEENIHTYGFDGFTLGYRDKVKPFKNGGIDELKVYNRALTSLEVLYHHDPEAASAALEDTSLTEKNKKLLYPYYAAHFDAKIKALQDSLDNNRRELNEVLNGIQEIMVMGDLDTPRPTYVLERGVYDAHGKEVKPGVPEVVLPFDEALPRNRLGLAKWLFDEDNPLTARVFVNRLWQMYFGRGIVKTSEDFGSQGELPSHPGLLDWLAVTFVKSGWNIKALQKQLLMSATYRQRSVTTPELIAEDPENILLARGSQYRMPAEMIRDNALAISGLLVKKTGGASVYPYQPEGLWDELSNKGWRYQYLQEPGEGLYRRSIYTIWKRTAPPPAMLIFDVPDRGVCTVRRRVTSTPLQALVLLNDPQYVEATRVLAERLLEDSISTEQQFRKAFRLITGRQPQVKELELLADFYQEELIRFTENKKDALAYINMGASDWDTSSDPAEIAALAAVSNALLNTYEGYTRK